MDYDLAAGSVDPYAGPTLCGDLIVSRSSRGHLRLPQKRAAPVDAACDSVVRVVQRVQPNQANAEAMQKNYAAYRRIYPAVKSIFSS